MVWMFLFLLAALTLRASDDEHVYELGDGIQPPRLVHQVNPDYSRVRGVRVKGSVMIAIIVTSEGGTRDPRVVQSLHPDVDRCAVDAVKQWRFAPAQKDGKPIAVHVTIELDFHPM